MAIGKDLLRSELRNQILVAATIATVSTAIFWLTDLDMTVARWAYMPDHTAGPWPLRHQPVWRAVYDSAAWTATALIMGSMVAMTRARLRRPSPRLHLHGLFVLLSLVVGPGVLVNGLLKGYWGRPRPQEVQELGGDLQYLPVLAKGEAGQACSFPSGHASVGYSVCALWFLWRRTRPWLARGALTWAAIHGTLLGIARVVGGGHFPSDVVWSGLLVFSVCSALYYVVLRVGEREAAIEAALPQPRIGRVAGIAYAVASASAIVLILLQTTPY